MIVSYIDGQYIYGIDYSDRGAVTLTVSDEQFAWLQNGTAYIVDGEVVEQQTQELTEQEIANQVAQQIQNEKNSKYKR